jgi:transcriptional regulator of acetoin/glycerol metabolism
VGRLNFHELIIAQKRGPVKYIVTLILQELEAADWVIGGPDGAAAKLDINRTTLLYKMKKLGLVRPIRGARGKPPVEVLENAELMAT